MKSRKSLLLNLILTVWACAIVIKTFSRILLLMNIGTRAANLAFILTQPVFIRTRWVNMTKKQFSFLRKEFPILVERISETETLLERISETEILLKIFIRNAFLQEEFSSIQYYCLNFSKLNFNHYFLLP